MTDMVLYAPAGVVLLLIGGIAAIVTADLVMIVSAGALTVLAFVAGIAVRKAGYGSEREGG